MRWFWKRKRRLTNLELVMRDWQNYVDTIKAIEKLRIPTKFLLRQYHAQMKKYKNFKENPPEAIVPFWFSFVQNFPTWFWFVLGQPGLSLLACFFNDCFIVLSVILRKTVARLLRGDLIQLLDFFQPRDYLLSISNFYSFKFYIRSLFWPREKWLFLLRQLTWKERAFKFFMSGPFGWLGFFYYFFWGTCFKCWWLLVT